MIKIDVDMATVAQLLTALATLLGVLGGILVSYRNGRKLNENTALTQKVHESTNGRLDSLVGAVQTAAEAAKLAAEQAAAVAARAQVPPSPHPPGQPP